MKVFTVVIIIFAALMIFDQKDAMPMDLSQFQWKNRLLLIFAPDENDSLFKKLQSEIIAQEAEVKDRDLIIFELFGLGSSRMNRALLDQSKVDSIRRHFSVPQRSFRVILIGKDGGIKLKRNDQIDLETIFELIDSMPMRNDEIRQKNQ
ncbi:MAG: DUF4174 domain-containing protein, partial [Deltaproteobacteria bacterium]|nr:DUF4174 domain-containing protein [Deltaproteobacteria bacterium]